MKKAIVWLGVVLLVAGTVVGVIANVLSDSSYSILIDAYETGDQSQLIRSIEQDRSANQIGIVSSVIVGMGMAFAFAGFLFEESFRPLPEYYTTPQQGVYSPQQPPQYPGQPPSQYPPRP